MIYTTVSTVYITLDITYITVYILLYTLIIDTFHSVYNIYTVKSVSVLKMATQ